MVLPREQSIPLEWAFAGATIVALLVLIAGFIAVQSRRRRHSSALWPVLIVIAVLVAWGAAGSWVRIHTGLGVFALGGANYWVHRALEAKDEPSATRYLQIILHSSQYGVNAAESAVLRLPNVADRVRLFTLLELAVPWENWKQTYRSRAATARNSRP